MKINFNNPTYTGNEMSNVSDVINHRAIASNGAYTSKCETWLEKNIKGKKALLTPSCTSALELASLILDVGPGDEVIMPSFTFVSTANAFAMRGAKVVFVDVDSTSMNIDPLNILNAITKKTKVIVVMHYAGLSCDMMKIMSIASQHSIYVVEDAAQCVGSLLDGKPVGSFGHLSTFSFHETKNITSGGEGGALIINDDKLVDKAEVIRSKGTNRKKFLLGKVDKYTWIDIGGNFFMSELQAAYLWAQLCEAIKINEERRLNWKLYRKLIEQRIGKHQLQEEIILPNIHNDKVHNGHIFYFFVHIKNRNALIEHLKINDIQATFHYIPLHTSPYGQRIGHFNGVDNYTTDLSARLIRLPLYHGISHDQINYIVDKIILFFEKIPIQKDQASKCLWE